MNKLMLTSTETAEYIGVSKSYLYRLTREKRIPYYNPRGKMIYFNREELNEWLSRNKSENEGDVLREVEETLKK
tara:strand:- start:216 stop:437 length:222 start_codon:yes stop_codon:yes gene_type:complete